MAVSSSSPAVASRCAHAYAGIGAVASQNVTDPRLGHHVLNAMANGMDADTAIASVIAATSHAAFRQLLAIDYVGRTAIFSGSNTLGINAEYKSQDAAAAGNLLANKTIPKSMVTTFHGTKGHLGDRLIVAIQAGLVAGGEAGGVHSAGLLIVDNQDWPLAELRCDWTEDCPIAAISAAWDVYKPQMNDYVTRALNPDTAPSYGVPGNL
tara:strand:- start:29 stop:655 length:627 start_codon:yes stop_codon:yes gene_type:complete